MRPSRGLEVGELSRWQLDPSWSRSIDVPAGHPDGHGAAATDRWHVLVRPGSDRGAHPVVCIHGNPTWGALWGPLLRTIDVRHTVIAPDLLGMGWSDRTGPRRVAQRVADLDRLLHALVESGDLDRSVPLILVAHDWGGAIAMGWAVDHPERLAGLVLTNTGIAVPEGRRVPPLIRVAGSRALIDTVTRRTPLFVRGVGRLPGHPIGRAEREALRAPYRRAADRSAVGDFVDDVPMTDDHPSAAWLSDVADRLPGLDVPALLVWGGRDPVFDDHFAADLRARLAHAELHRIGDAGHLVPLHPAAPRVVAEWIASRAHRPDGVARATPGAGIADRLVDSGVPWARLDARSADPAIAFHDGASGRGVSFAELSALVDTMAVKLRAHGVHRGDRIGVLVPPSVELIAAVYACWRVGAVTVIADRGLGLGGLGRALASAAPRFLLGPRRARIAARAMRWVPTAGWIDVNELAAPGGDDVDRLPRRSTDQQPPSPDDEIAVLFTSGATGPAKGVRYTVGQLVAQRDALERCYSIGPDDRFVAAFAPFALYGPALGIASAIPDVDVTSPGALTAGALDASCRAIDATLVFASPAALANVVATASADGMPGVELRGLARVRTLMSAGAPVPIRTLRSMARLVPAATLHTPYGMTETLPVADIDLAGLELVEAGGRPGRGVCVGAPVTGCDVMVAPLGFDPGTAVEPLAEGSTGEILVRAAWTSTGYDRLWHTQHTARPLDQLGARWHRSGDVGHLDAEGRLWIEGRSVHVISTVDGAVTPVPIEVAAERLDGVERSAAVGVGPPGVQQVVVVVESRTAPRRGASLADRELTDRIRDAVSAVVPTIGIAAVCVVRRLPVDIRHNAKIDRSAVAVSVGRLLEGGG